jgi:LacI family transcriptional regulator
MKKEKASRLILVLLRPDSAYDREILRGISSAAASSPSCRLRLLPYGPTVLDGVRLWNPDAVMGRIENRETWDGIRAMRLPLVCTTNSVSWTALPRVGMDDLAIGAMAADHFLSRGFTHFGFVSAQPHAQFSIQRAQGYRDRLREAGHAVHEAKNALHYGAESRIKIDPVLARWVTELPKPAAVFAANDGMGYDFVEVCRESGIRVPEDLAVLGVDNDELLCDIAHPPLSSIALPARKAGEEAFALLQRLMSGKGRQTQGRLLPPEGVITRRSTDILAISEPRVAAAVRYIHDHAADAIRVSDVLEAVPMARRSLEQLFRRILHRTPLMEINRVHIHLARHLLARTDLPLEDVAEKSGLNSRQRFSTLFRRETGHTPAAYRRLFRQ